MIEFLVDGEWCGVDHFAQQAPAVARRGDGFWRNLEWHNLGFLNVSHPEHGSIVIIPKYFAWRLK